jgi:hypothetical protein
MAAANHIAYTAPINPSGATPVLTPQQIWTALQHKIVAAEKFVGAAILSTDVLSKLTDSFGHAVTEREIVFREGNRRVHETCVEFPQMKVEFRQPDGSTVMNIVSEGARGAEEGDLWMTYTFEWLHPGASEEELGEKRVKEKRIAAVAVEHTIRAMREMVISGEIK